MSENKLEVSDVREYWSLLGLLLIIFCLHYLATPLTSLIGKHYMMTIHDYAVLTSITQLTTIILLAVQFILVLPLRAKAFHILWNKIFMKLFNTKEISYGIALVITFVLAFVI